MPALLSLSLPVTAAIAVHTGPVACAAPAVGVDACVRIDLNATACAPAPGAWCGTPPPGCGTAGTPPGSCTTVGAVVGEVSGLVHLVAGHVAIDIGAATTLVDSIVTGGHCQAAPPPAC
jgi:hypothetical protein